MSTSPAGAGALPPDLHCIDCGYNLRGLPTDGACPECGTSIERSMRGDALRFANVEWLKKVRLGLAVIVSADVFGHAMTSIIAMWGPWASIWLGLWVLLNACSCVGIWLVISREPRHSEASPRQRLEKVALYAAATTLACSMLSAGLTVAAPSWGISISYSIAALSGEAAIIALLLLLRRLALRDNEHRMVQKSRRLAIAILPVYLALWVLPSIFGPIVFGSLFGSWLLMAMLASIYLVHVLVILTVAEATLLMHRAIRASKDDAGARPEDSRLVLDDVRRSRIVRGAYALGWCVTLSLVLMASRRYGFDLGPGVVLAIAALIAYAVAAVFLGRQNVIPAALSPGAFLPGRTASFTLIAAAVFFYFGAMTAFVSESREYQGLVMLGYGMAGLCLCVSVIAMLFQVVELCRAFGTPHMVYWAKYVRNGILLCPVLLVLFVVAGQLLGIIEWFSLALGTLVLTASLFGLGVILNELRWRLERQ